MKKKKKIKLKKKRIVGFLIFLLVIGVSIYLMVDGRTKPKEETKKDSPNVKEEEPKVEEPEKVDIPIDYILELHTVKGKKIDLLRHVKTDAKVTVSGEYNFNEVGTYSLYYELELNGDKDKVPFTLVVDSKDTNYKTTNSRGYTIEYKDGITYVDGYMIVNKSFSIPKRNISGLTSDTTDAYNKMVSDAKKEGLSIRIRTGYRSYDFQASLYNNYVKKDGKAKADTYSARPGNSEHHTGYALDVNSLSESFGNTKEGIWLSNNCYKYGFILRYPKDKSNETGYIYEPWHFRYVGKELAAILYNDGDWITMEDYYGLTSQYED